MTTVTIAQPVATIHNDCGYMTAIRVVLLTVNTSTPFIKAKQPMLLSSFASLKIEQICDIKVKEISLIDLGEDKYLRNLLWCKNNGVRGASALTAVLSDGSVVNPRIYHYIGSVDGYGYSRYMTYIDTGYCCDYKGNCIPLAQMEKVEPTARAILLDEDDKSLQKTPSFEWGNLNHTRTPIHIAVPTTDFESVERKRSLSAAQLTLPTSTCTAERFFATYAYKTAAEYQITDEAAPVQVVPLGFGAVKVRTSKCMNLKRIKLPRGIAELRMEVMLPIQVISDDYVSGCFINCAHATEPFQLPKIASIPGSKIAAALIINLASAQYSDTDWDISKDAYDIGRLQVMLKAQLCRSVTLPAVNNTEASLHITQPYFMLRLVKPKYKYMMEGMLHEFSEARACALIHYTEGARNIVVDASKMRSNLRLIFDYQGTVARSGASVVNVMLPKTARGASVSITTNTDLNEKYTGTQGIRVLGYNVRGAALGSCAAAKSITHFDVHIEEFVLDLGDMGTSCVKHIYLSGGVDSIALELLSLRAPDLLTLFTNISKRVVLHVAGDIHSMRIAWRSEYKHIDDLEATMIQAGFLMKM